MRKSTIIAIVSFVGVLLFSYSIAYAASYGADAGKKSVATGEDKSALILMKKTERKIRRILAVKTKKGTKKHRAKKLALKRVINRLFDFKELARQSLDEHWNEISESERKEFVDLLQKLIEKNYLMRISEHTKYRAKFTHYECDGKTARVTVKVKSGKYEFEFQFVLYKTSKGKWAIFDMVIDDVSLIENYRSQFNKIIKKSGFKKLLTKMRKKLDED